MPYAADQSAGAEGAMCELWRAAAAVFGSISLLLANTAQSPAQAAEVKVFLTGAARGAYEILAPQFERASGHKLVTQSGLPPELIAKIDAGEPFDVIVLSYDVEALIKRGKVEASSRTVQLRAWTLPP
jgi:molybdate transport system substrate-binding protein